MMQSQADSQGERIDMQDAALVAIWAKRLDVSPTQIQEAVDAVGSLAADVEMHLKGSHSTTNADRMKKAL